MIRPEIFVLDVDGVMTTGQFLYSTTGKVYKTFGPDDADSLKILKKFLKIIFISADERGFGISKKRIQNDLGFDIFLVSSKERLKWLNKYNYEKMIYMGDGVFDSIIFSKVLYSICPKNSFHFCLEKANYITRYNGGERAVADACMHILKKFFGMKNIKDYI